MDFRAEYEKWCTDPYFDEATKAELKAIAGDDKEIEDRFYRTLEFGTAGLRGVIGAGTNRMNIYTVRQASQGLANYILSQGEDAVKRGVAIAHDSRNMHDEFTDATALSLAANGNKTYVFPQHAPLKAPSKYIKNVYTPRPGTGHRPVQSAHQDLGFENVYIEPSQAVPDGNFPTCPYPNPENPDAWKLALELAKEKDADIVLATDPDADRLGVYCKDTKTGEYVTFTGNMSAMLIGEYI